MAKKSAKKAATRKKREPRKIRVVVGKENPTIEDVELAINKKLATQPTNLFRNTETLIIIVEDEGSRPHHED